MDAWVWTSAVWLTGWDERRRGGREREKGIEHGPGMWTGQGQRALREGTKDPTRDTDLPKKERKRGEEEEEEEEKRRGGRGRKFAAVDWIGEASQRGPQQHPDEDEPPKAPPAGELGEFGECWGPSLIPFASLLMSKTPSWILR